MNDKAPAPRLEVDDVIVVDTKRVRTAIGGTVVGNFMEWFDFGIYGYLAVTLSAVFEDTDAFYLVVSPTSPQWEIPILHAPARAMEPVSRKRKGAPPVSATRSLQDLASRKRACRGSGPWFQPGGFLRLI